MHPVMISSSSSTSWITSLECSASVIQPSDNSSHVSIVMNWLGFIFLSPCSQRVLISCTDAIFLLAILGFGMKKLFSRFILTPSSINEPFLGAEKSQFRVTLWFYLSLIVTALLAVCYTVLSILAFSHGIQSKWGLVETLFRLAQAITFCAISALIAHEKKYEAVVHPLSLRIFWVANFVTATLFAASAIARMISHGSDLNASVRTDDIVSLVSFPISTFLFVVAVLGSSGVCLVREPYEPNSIDSNVSDYAIASRISKLFWLWMNPLLSKGYKSPLKIDDVPSLPDDYGASKMEELFEINWPKPEENSKNPVRTTLFRCFWKQIVFTGVLTVIRLAVMYVGPLLIKSFVSFANGKKADPFEGYYLLSILLVAKVVEVLSSHHFSFESRNVGMLIRSSLIATLYKKGMKLSCSSRQSHGVGQIVNYMAVDCQRLSDAMANFHPIWIMPLQVGVAVALLYHFMEASVFAALIAVIMAMFVTVWITRRTNKIMFQGMMCQDKRMKATNEMLNNMRVIKLQAWEEHFNKRIQSLRNNEYGWLSKFMYSISVNSIVLSTITLVISALTFSTALLLGISLDAGKLFTATTLLRILQEPLQSFPQALVSLTQALISLKRLDDYLTSGELDSGLVEREEGCEGRIAVEVKDGIFSWDDEGGEEVLKGVNLEIKKGELTAIVGTVGSGKSSLLASILGELNKLSGEVKVCGTTAYVAQTSWIQNATIQDNILFGTPMKNERYKEVIRVCCLEKDLDIMDHGDQTEIGERGINLSGGQKQRIQLARAVYQDCDIYLLDDVFSAVDAHTGSEIFKECVRGLLKDKTILLVTHQVDFLHKSDLILVMRDGKIVQSGRYEELLESGMDFGALVAAHETSMELVEKSATIQNENHPQAPKSLHASAIQREQNGDRAVDQSKSAGSKLIDEEVRETGQINFQAYKHYWTESFGWYGVGTLIVIALLSQASSMSSDYWMQYETSSRTTFRPSLFICVYWIIIAVSGGFFAMRTFLVSFMGLRTAQRFFNQILHSIMHAPMSFFDTTPSGRILTRASNDQSMVDFFIPFVMSASLLLYFQVFGAIFVTCQSAWPTIFLLIPLGWLNIWYQTRKQEDSFLAVFNSLDKAAIHLYELTSSTSFLVNFFGVALGMQGYYLATSREITRLDSITKAPIIHHFSETITGITTIRSFKKQQEFVNENIHRINANLRMEFHNNGSSEWLGFRLEMIGSFILCVATMFMIVLPSTVINTANIGLFLSYGLSLNIILYYAVWTNTLVENRMISVERIKQFISIPSEAPWRISGSLPSPHWPNHGDIEIQNLQVRYRPGTPLVLKSISLNINGGEKIGIVGRTGSGKSTLIQVFFRLVEPSGGKIIIDGVDICTLGLHDLRSRFAIIPQDPVLFQGTVRSNIDPIGLYSDEDIWKSLERCQLKNVVAAKPDKLNASVVDSGDNWSVGQRQLLCLGRIMLKRSRILFMDEATASVDSQTDALIQNIIREDFTSCTIITIAHRIPTVIDCDRVLVIDEGWAKEFDRPSSLLERRSLFGALVQEYATRSVDL